jgi:hypothetical protein
MIQKTNSAGFYREHSAKARRKGKGRLRPVRRSFQDGLRKCRRGTLCQTGKKDRVAGIKEEFEEKRRRSSSEILFDFYHGLTPGNGFIDIRGQGK